MSDMNSELKPCPFCGEKAVYRSRYDYEMEPYRECFIECTKCSVKIPSELRHPDDGASPELREVWNQRHQPNNDKHDEVISKMSLCPEADPEPNNDKGLSIESNQEKVRVSLEAFNDSTTFGQGFMKVEIKEEIQQPSQSIESKSFEEAWGTIELSAKARQFGRGAADKDIARAYYQAGQSSKQDWVAVEDGLPEYDSYALVEFETVTGKLMQCVAQFVSQSVHAFEDSPKSDKWYVYPSRGHTIKPIAWQPLPPMPTKG